MLSIILRLEPCNGMDGTAPLISQWIGQMILPLGHYLERLSVEKTQGYGFKALGWEVHHFPAEGYSPQ